MKKKLFLGMAALLGMSLAFTACSNDDDPAGAAVNDNAIGFSVLTNNAAGTRATAVNAATGMANFQVWATKVSDGSYYLGSSTQGIQINGTNGTFDYANSEDIHYWPTEALTFYAISPISTDDAPYTVAGSGLHYEVPSNVFNQVDLMHASYGIASKPSDGKVSLTFSHLLSQIAFKARVESKDMTVDIQSVTIHNVINSADFSKINELTADRTNGSTRAGFSTGTLTSKTVTYSAPGNPATGHEGEVDLTGNDRLLMLIPQTLTKWTDNTTIAAADLANECYIEVKAKIKVNGSYLLGTADNYGTTYIGLGTTWNGGTKYIYTLVFGSKNGGNNGGGKDKDGNDILTPINFDVTVTPWVTPGDTDTEHINL